MIFTLLCPMLLLESWTTGFSQVPTSHISQNLSSFNSLPNRTIVNTLHNLSSVNEQQEQNHIISVSTSRQRRGANRHAPRDWYYSPTLNPYTYPRRPSSSSTGLAYRSIIPQRNSNDYTKYYRNRDLFSGDGSQGGGSGSTVQAHEESFKSSPSFKTINRNSNNKNNHKNDLKSTTLVVVQSTTTREPSRSAPATDAFSGTLSSTVQMQIESLHKKEDSQHLDQEEQNDSSFNAKEEEDGMVKDRVEIPGSSIVIPKRIGKSRRRQQQTQDQETMIVFPGHNTNGANNNNGTRKNHMKSTDAGSLGVGGNDEGIASYVPPLLKSYDRATLESLRRLIEARKRAEMISNATRNVGSGGQGRGSTSLRHQQERAKNVPNVVLGAKNFLDIAGPPPKCDTVNEETAYCDNVEDYPKDYFNQVLKKYVSPDEFQDIYGDADDPSESELNKNYTSRNDIPQSQETPLCNAIEHTIYPKVARNKEGKFMYVVNHDEYIQGVRVEKCIDENNECNQLRDGIMPGFQSVCRQKYIYKKLLAFNSDGKAMTDTFKLPSCCVCYLKSTYVSDRIEPGSSSVLTKKSPEEDNTGNPNSNGTSTSAYPSIYADEKATEASPLSDFVSETTDHEILTFPGLIDDFSSRNNHSLVMEEEAGGALVTSGPFFRNF